MYCDQNLYCFKLTGMKKTIILYNSNTISHGDINESNIILFIDNNSITLQVKYNVDYWFGL